jgi:hypothetical protein
LKKKKKKRKKKYNKQGSEWEAVSWRIASHAIKMKQPVSRWGPSSSTGRVPSIILIRNILIRAYIYLSNTIRLYIISLGK